MFSRHIHFLLAILDFLENEMSRKSPEGVFESSQGVRSIKLFHQFCPCHRLDLINFHAPKPATISSAVASPPSMGAPPPGALLELVPFSLGGGGGACNQHLPRINAIPCYHLYQVISCASGKADLCQGVFIKRLPLHRLTDHVVDDHLAFHWSFSS